MKHLPRSQKSVSLHCVFHSIRFKVNKGWSKALLLFLCPYLSYHTNHAKRTRGIFPRMRYTSILTFHQTITLVCLSKPAEVRALHRFACRHKQKLQQQVCELREPVFHSKWKHRKQP